VDNFKGEMMVFERDRRRRLEVNSTWFNGSDGVPSGRVNDAVERRGALAGK